MYIAQNYLQTLPAEISLLVMLFFCWFTVIATHRTLGTNGLSVYAVVATICANIQVLRAAELSFLPEPIVLGNIVFATIFTANDIIALSEGRQAACRAVRLAFYGSVVFAILMFLTIGVKPIQHQAYYASQQAIETLFTPAIAIIAASLISYYVSMHVDIYLIYWLRSVFKHIWLSSFISTMLGSLMDSCLFSFLAWRLFAENPVPYYNLWHSYILGPWSIALCLGFCNAFIVSLAVGKKTK